MAVKASDNFKVYENKKGPKISTVTRKIIEKDKMYFKDIDGSGKVSKVNDWRLPAEERAKAYVKLLSTEEKIGQLFISDWRMGKYVPELEANAKGEKSEPKLDESGTLDEAPYIGKTIFGEQNLPGTSTLLKEWFARHLILRANAQVDEIADYLNIHHSTVWKYKSMGISILRKYLTESGNVRPEGKTDK